MVFYFTFLLQGSYYRQPACFQNPPPLSKQIRKYTSLRSNPSPVTIHFRLSFAYRHALSQLWPLCFGRNTETLFTAYYDHLLGPPFPFKFFCPYQTKPWLFSGRIVQGNQSENDYAGVDDLVCNLQQTCTRLDLQFDIVQQWGRLSLHDIHTRRVPVLNWSDSIFGHTLRRVFLRRLARSKCEKQHFKW